MRRILAVALLAASTLVVHAQQDDPVALELTEFTAPWRPTMSALEVRVPTSVVIDEEVFSRIDAAAWYTAYSPFLVPVPFAEIGVQAGYRVVDREITRVSLFAGAAVEFFDGLVSVPFVGSLEALFTIPLGLQTGLKTDVYVWGAGVGIEGYVPIRFLPANFPLYGGVEPGYSVIMAGTTIVHNPKIGLVIGYRF